MHIIGRVGKRLRRERIPSAPEVKILEVLLEMGDAWSYGYLLHKKHGISVGTAYKWIARFSEEGYFEEEFLVVQGRQQHVVRLNKKGVDFAMKRLRAAESEMEYRRGEMVANDST